MILELEPGVLIGALVTISGSIFGASKMLFARFDTSLRERDDGLKEELNKLTDKMASESDAIRKLDREILELRAELPEKYLTRMDFNRTFTVIEAKLDRIYVQGNQPK